MKNILIVDDDKNILTTLEVHLEDRGLITHLAHNGREAVERFKSVQPEIVLLDLKLPDMDGLAVLEKILTVNKKTYVVMITAYAAVDTAVKAVKLGAYDYLPKPFTPSQIDHLLHKIDQVSSLESEVETLKARLKGIEQESGFITKSPKVRAILKIARQAADSNATILITGESGTGKGLLAQLIHDYSPRKNKRFVRVDCTVLQDSLLESDLFGHKKGAFTGAVANKEGKLETADGGTVFLDEITEMSEAIQAKLLHFLQSREFTKLGDTRITRVDARVLAATNRNLERIVEENLFRRDLYYRLNVVEIQMPSLRDRPEDIPLLAEFYLKRHAEENNRQIKGIDEAALNILKNYPWPGNIRELINVIQRATILSDAASIGQNDLPGQIVNYRKPADSAEALLSLNEMEKEHIRRVLARTDTMDEAARILGIDPATLWRKRKKYRLD